MILTPRQCYDTDELVLYNMHMHLAPFSTCAKKEMRISDVIAECNKQGYKAVAFTNHFHQCDCPMMSDNKKIKRAAEIYEKNFKLYFGMELSSVGMGQRLDTDEQNESLDYRLYACNHYQKPTWTHPEEKTAAGYIQHCYDNTKQIILSRKADAIAHPLHGTFIEDIPDNTAVTNGYSDDMIYELMLLASENDVAWELNLKSILTYPDLNRRFWNIGKQAGVTFVYGSDAHSLSALDICEAKQVLKSVFK